MKGKSEILQFSIHILIFVVVKSISLKSVAYVASEGSMRNKDRNLAEIPEGKSGRRPRLTFGKEVYCLTWFRYGKIQCRTVMNIVINSIHINHQPDATIFQFIILTFIYS
jgi:hypothetical protein